MKKSMTMKAAVLTAILILMAMAVPAFAQETDSYEGEAPFIQELALRLAERGWNGEQVREMVRASREFQWNGLEPELAELTAYALQKGLEGEPAGFVDSPRVRAQLALGLATAAREMERLGYDEQLVARAAAESVRSMNMDMKMNQKRTGENDEATGELLRDRLRDRLRDELEAQELQQQIRLRKGDGSGAGAGASGADRDSASGTPIGP